MIYCEPRSDASGRLRFKPEISALESIRKVLTLVQPAMPGRRKAPFDESFALAPGTLIIDIGGSSEIWNLIERSRVSSQL
jgi:hypothetical protein